MKNFNSNRGFASTLSTGSAAISMRMCVMMMSMRKQSLDTRPYLLLE